MTRKFNRTSSLTLPGSAAITKSLCANFTRSQIFIGNSKTSSLDLLTQFVRCTSFFNRLTGQQLWKGVTSVSNAGRKKGRGRGGDRKNVRNLNAGQRIGAGKIRVLWPGLNVPIIKNKEMQLIRETKKTEEAAQPAPPPIRKRLSSRVHPLDRGWSGRQQRGKKIGPPQPIQDETFKDFESIILEHRFRSQMTSILGRRRKYFSIVATGNGKGIIGVGRAKSIDFRTAISLARTRASKRLLTVDLIDGHTVNHDFFCEYGRTRVFVFKKPEGYGLRCHRVITALCQLVGIRDLSAKVEGAVNTTHIIRAFLMGLIRQKTYQEIADETRLHLVEFRRERDDFPLVLASPEKCLTLREAQQKPIVYEEFIMGGRLPYVREKKVPFYQKLPSWTVHLQKTLFHRNHDLVKLNLRSEYGALESHLTRIYPECSRRARKKEKSD